MAGLHSNGCDMGSVLRGCGRQIPCYWPINREIFLFLRRFRRLFDSFTFIDNGLAIPPFSGTGKSVAITGNFGPLAGDWVHGGFGLAILAVLEQAGTRRHPDLRHNVTIRVGVESRKCHRGEKSAAGPASRRPQLLGSDQLAFASITPATADAFAASSESGPSARANASILS